VSFWNCGSGLRFWPGGPSRSRGCMAVARRIHRCETARCTAQKGRSEGRSGFASGGDASPPTACPLVPLCSALGTGIVPYQHCGPLHEVGSSLVKSRCGPASRGCQRLLTERWCVHRDSEAPRMEDTPPEQSSGAR